MTEQDKFLVKSQHPLTRYDLTTRKELVLRGLSALSEVRDAEFYYIKGTEHFHHSEYDSAISYYEKALEIDTKHTDSLVLRGCCYQEKGDYDKAISDYSKAIEIDPNDYYAHQNRGYLYTMKGEYDQAISDYSKLIEMFPSTSHYYDRGWTYYYMNDYDNAIQDLIKSINLDPNYNPPYYLLALCQERIGAYQSSLDNFEKYLCIVNREEPGYHKHITHAKDRIHKLKEMLKK